MARYVACFRVSTEKQGKSGLGLAAQHSLIERFLSDGDEVIAEYVEVQSGKNDERVELWKAIHHAHQSTPAPAGCHCCFSGKGASALGAVAAGTTATAAPLICPTTPSRLVALRSCGGGSGRKHLGVFEAVAWKLAL
jgi:hypothetical protein